MEGLSMVIIKIHELTLTRDLTINGPRLHWPDLVWCRRVCASALDLYASIGAPRPQTVVHEVPITFDGRSRGKSKMTSRIIFEGMRLAWAMRR